MDKRTYRKCVRVIVIKGNQILLGKKFIKGKFVCYEFPGGGVEQGDTFEQTVIKECLEEVGIQVKNVQSLGLYKKYDIDYPDPERAKLFKGGEDNWYMAEYLQTNKKDYGADNDALPYSWEKFDKAVKMIKEGPESEYNPARFEAIERVKDILNKKEKMSLENW